MNVYKEFRKVYLGLGALALTIAMALATICMLNSQVKSLTEEVNYLYNSTSVLVEECVQTREKIKRLDAHAMTAKHILTHNVELKNIEDQNGH